MNTLDRYLEDIAAIPLLSREEQIEVGRSLTKARRRFFAAVSLLPATAPLLLERWRELADNGRSVEPLVEGFRGPGGAARGREFTRRMQRLAECAASGAPPRRAARDVLGAQIAFGVMEEIWRSATAPPATDEDELRLQGHAERAHARYVDHRSRLTRHNLRLVIAFAKRFRYRGVAFLDLVQEGNQALMRAVEKFEPERGHSFTGYATWWIEQAMIRALQTQGGAIRLPTHAHQLKREFLDRERKMRCLEPEPTRADVARELAVKGERLRRLDATLAKVVSADQARWVGDHAPLGAVLVDPAQRIPSDYADAREIRDALVARVATLPQREGRVLEWRFGLIDDDEHSLEAVGQKLGLSRERVRQIQRNALARLRSEDGIRHLARDLGIELNEKGGEHDERTTAVRAVERRAN